MMTVVMFTLTETLNPDWFGYAAIFTEGGAWLDAQGRDPLFSLLVSSAVTVLGPDHCVDRR